MHWEWPKTCEGWKLHELLRAMKELSWTLYQTDGCALGLKDPKNGKPYKKEWMVASTRPEVGERLARYRCNRRHDHQPLIGGRPAATAYYPQAFADAVVDGVAEGCLRDKSKRHGQEDKPEASSPCQKEEPDVLLTCVAKYEEAMAASQETLDILQP